MRGRFEASIFQRIFLEYGGSREEYEKNILELFKKNIVFMLTAIHPRGGGFTDMAARKSMVNGR